MKLVKIVAALALFALFALVGFVIHSFEKGSGGWIFPGNVYYTSKRIDTIYSWEPGYNSWTTNFSKIVTEKDCGDLEAIIRRSGTLSRERVAVLKGSCGGVGELRYLFQEYFSAVQEDSFDRRFSYDTPKQQLETFNFLKEAGAFENVRYKETRHIEWDSILDFLYRVVLLPVLAAILIIFIIPEIYKVWKGRKVQK